MKLLAVSFVVNLINSLPILIVYYLTAKGKDKIIIMEHYVN